MNKLRAGQQTYCRSCQHFAADAHAQGHPRPCSKFGWRGVKHVKPMLTEDGCLDWDEREPEPVAERAWSPMP